MTLARGQHSLLRRPGLMALAATLMVLAVVVFAACGAPTATPEPTPVPLVLVAELGGDTTAFTTTRNAFAGLCAIQAA